MALIRPVRGVSPRIGENCFIAETAVIVGDVVIGNNCSIWYNIVLRGDENPIRIGNNVNIQDGVVLHCRSGKSSINVGNNVTIGHNATIHGAILEDAVLVGMGAVVLDNSIVRTKSIVAAGSLVTYNTDIESLCIYGGVPAKKIRALTEEEVPQMILKVAQDYIKYINWYKE